MKTNLGTLSCISALFCIEMHSFPFNTVLDLSESGRLKNIHLDDFEELNQMSAF